tara:strand:+ start:155 stop:508 length:354 start_codon:yes stop_codon:yes gene_type:complete
MTQYRNRHNGKLITLIGSEITDSGNTLHTVKREDGDHKGCTDYIGQYQLEKHWEFITEGPMAFDDPSWGLRQDAEFAADEFSRDDLIEHLISLYKTIEAHDACDTHSQTINTSDGEE